VIEADDWRDLPPFSLLVRRAGKAVAAYSHHDYAEAHLGPLEDAVIWPDRCTTLSRPSRMWTVARAQRERARRAVDELAAQWLAGCNAT
jgi:hypothetical protein